MAFPEFQTKEVLNKVLNTDKDALKVDIDNVTLDGSQLSVDIDKENDSIVIFSNTAADGSGTNTVPLVDAAGHTQVDIVSSALPSGGATAANQTTMITALQLLDNAVDGNYLNVNANIAGTDFVGGAGAVAAGVQRVTLASDDPAVTDLAAMEVLLGTIDDDTNAIKGHVDGIETLITSTNSKIDTFDAVLDAIKTDTGTIDSDTDAVKTATEASQASLADMIYGTAVAIDIDSGNHTSLTHNALYVGTGGNVKVNMGTSGSGITFSNVASGQILPIQITQVYQSGTTASNMVALKE
jgi:hypothetical protein